ncbi:hypothetical protein BGZ96_003141 [Linnemannia gamsii]|uniref:Uncharacterized protein n=1 Tax=Linnemannia gamsii TaxID=64522 RepID=A0ABQ7JJS7_9FUNG|nr:hypothetical protein BGZ96_003141 [Linnemannia gamsii]
MDDTNRSLSSTQFTTGVHQFNGPAEDHNQAARPTEYNHQTSHLIKDHHQASVNPDSFGPLQVHPCIYRGPRAPQLYGEGVVDMSGEEYDVVPHSTEDDGQVVHLTEDDGQAVHPIEDDGQAVHPTEDDGQVVHPTEDDGQAVHPTEDDGQAVHPTEDDGQAVHPTEDGGESVHPTEDSDEDGNDADVSTLHRQCEEEGMTLAEFGAFLNSENLNNFLKGLIVDTLILRRYL